MKTYQKPEVECVDFAAEKIMDVDFGDISGEENETVD